MVAPFTAKTGVNVDVQEVGWDVQFDRIRNAAVSGEGPDITQAGTTQVPFFAALGGFTRPERPRRGHRRQGRLRRGHLEHDPGRGPGGHVGGPVVHGGALDLLPQGRPREGRRRPGDRVQGPRLVQGHAAGDQGQGPGHRALRRAGQEGVRPRPQRDAVRVGQRRRRALRGRQAVDDQLARGPGGRRVHGWPDHRRAVRQEPARARRHAGREPVQGRPAGGLDRRPVGARLDQPRRGRHVGARGPQERRRRADADRPAARPTRSWAART